MDNKIHRARRQIHRPASRRLIQLYSALLYNAHLKGFITGEIYQGVAKYACVPGLNCYSCPGAVGACPLGALQNALAAAGHRTGWYILGILLLFGTVLGRTICGWICPFGLIQELLYRIPTYKIKKGRVTKLLSYLKYVLLAVFVIAIPLWYGLMRDLPFPAFCKFICPAGTLEGAVGLLSHPDNSDLFGMLGLLFTNKFVIMLLTGLTCIFCYRGFCRFICPLGAIYGFFNRFCLVGVKVDPERCNGCGACVRSCRMDVKHVGDHECIHCADCMEVCSRKAIVFRAGKITLQDPEAETPGKTGTIEKPKKARQIARGLVLGILCFALLWFNILDPSLRRDMSAGPVSGAAGNADTSLPEGPNEPASAEEAFASTAPIGYEAGMQLEDFTTECLDGSVFHLKDTRGKVVFLNLWATYCAPCIRELPYFDALYHEHEEDIAVLAIHSSVVVDEPAQYLADKGWTISFALDTEDDRIWGIVNGSSTLPQTIVLNRRGEVIYNQKGSVTPAMLAALYEQAVN